MKQEGLLALIIAILMVGLSACIPLEAGATEGDSTSEEDVIAGRLDTNALGLGLFGCCSTCLAGTGGGTAILVMGLAAAIVSVVCFALVCLSLPLILVLTPVAVVLLLLCWAFWMLVGGLTPCAVSFVLLCLGVIFCLTVILFIPALFLFFAATGQFVAGTVMSLVGIVFLFPVLCVLTFALLLAVPVLFALAMLTLALCAAILALLSLPCALLSCTGGLCCSPVMGTAAYLTPRLWREYGSQIRGLMDGAGVRLGQLAVTTAPVQG